MFKMSKTYANYSETALNEGATDDHGFVYVDREFDSLEDMANEIKYATYSSGYFQTELEQDVVTGNQIIYAYHPALNESQMKDLRDILK